MAVAVSSVKTALARIRREPLADVRIADQFNQLCRDAGHVWRETLLTPLMTLRLFVLQVLHGNTSITHLRQLCGIGFAPASYCEARQRLPLEILTTLITRMVRWAADACVVEPLRLIGQRVWVVDGSSFSTSDTPELREHFGLPGSSQVGVGYPVGKLLGLLDAATGMFLSLLALPLFTHDAGCVVRVHHMLRCGDILLGDRAFCSFAHVALLNRAGVFACFRLHQRRKTSTRRGVERWRRDTTVPTWMTAAQWAQLPKWLDVRIVRYTVREKGRRTREVIVATTLLDETLWPDAKLAELYGLRWEIETCFNHLKTTMRMNVLKCQSVDGVMKELAVYLLAYNLVRLAMLREAHRRGINVKRVSFIDALRWLCCAMLGVGGGAELQTNPHRPGRREPRVIRRRLKEYNLMKLPRAELKRTQKWGDNR